MADPDFWRRCSACKNPIEFGSTYWACNVSTCNRKRTGLAFCSVDCWEVHLPTVNHRESWAVEKNAPTAADPPEPTPTQRNKLSVTATGRPAVAGAQNDGVLIVASRLKDYVKARAGYNTSDGVLAPLSEIVRRVCDKAIDNARREGRMTVLDRDIPEDL